MARFIQVVVLPSPGIALVIISFLHSFESTPSVKLMFVLIALYASIVAKSDWLFKSVLILFFVCASLIDSRLFLAITASLNFPITLRMPIPISLTSAFFPSFLYCRDFTQQRFFVIVCKLFAALDSRIQQIEYDNTQTCKHDSQQYSDQCIGTYVRGDRIFRLHRTLEDCNRTCADNVFQLVGCVFCKSLGNCINIVFVRSFNSYRQNLGFI